MNTREPGNLRILPLTLASAVMALAGVSCKGTSATADSGSYDDFYADTGSTGAVGEYDNIYDEGGVQKVDDYTGDSSSYENAAGTDYASDSGSSSIASTASTYTPPKPKPKPVSTPTVSKPKATPASTKYHVVQKGETLYRQPRLHEHRGLDLPGRGRFRIRDFERRHPVELSRPVTMDEPASIPRHFAFGDAAVVSLNRIGIGHINETFLVAMRDHAGKVTRFVIQRLNRGVFPDAGALMENVERVTRHLGRSGGAGGRSLALVPTREGATYHRDSSGECWRAFPYVEGTFTIEVVNSPGQARQAGRAFGRFSRILSDLPGARLHETIPDFHNTPKRLEDFVAAVEADPLGRVKEARDEIEGAMALAPWAGMIAEAQASGAVPERVAHNDAKIENVLFDRVSGEAVCVVDLDTVMPGTVLHDFGDLVRTAAATAAEDERNLERVGISLPIFGALAEGFLAACGDVLRPAEIALLPSAGKVIAYEQAVRFLGDYLLGDPYYRIKRAEHNLERARNQLRIATLLDSLRDDLGALIPTPPSPCNSLP